MAKRTLSDWRREHPVEYLLIQIRSFEKNFVNYKKQHYWCRHYCLQAIKYGLLIKPVVCEECSKESVISAHHEDYSKPLSCRFLCRSCHNIADEARNLRLGIVKSKPNHRRRYLDTQAYELVHQLWDSGMTQVKIGVILGISNSTCSKILSGKIKQRVKRL